MDAFCFKTLDICSAACELIGPILVAGLFRLTIKKVNIVLTHDVGCDVNGVVDVAL